MMYKKCPWSKTCRQQSDDHAVSEVVGSALLLSIVITATLFFILLGTNTLDNARSAATANGVEQAFTMADSRLSKARFSTAIFQEAPFKVNGGVVNVNGSWGDSHIIIYDFDNITKTTTVIYNQTLGTIKCTTDGGVVAYQDGGVWRLDNAGGSVMISPPDFDYNGITLTLPIMRIDGTATLSASGGGGVIINVKSADSINVFPSTSYSNPVPPNHFINITIKSDYYRAWADYINERTRATAETDPSKKIVNVSLSTGVGRQSGLVENGYSTKSMDTSYDAPILAFTLDIITHEHGVGNNYEVVYGNTPAGNPSLHISIGRTTGGMNQEFDKIDVSFQNGTVEEVWRGYTQFYRKSEKEIGVNLLNHTLMMNYTSDSMLQSATWGDNPMAYDSPPYDPIDEYDDPAHPDVTYDSNVEPQKTLYDIIEHYMLLMAKYDQASGHNGGPQYIVTNNGQNDFDRYRSNYYLEYISSQDLKYLYVTEGKLETSLASSG